MKAIDLYKMGEIMSGTDGDEEYVINGKSGADQLFFINKALADIRMKPVGSIGDELNIGIPTADAISAGIAYYLALRGGDRDRAAFLCDLYNAKRASALSQITRIKCSSAFKN